MLTGGLWTLLDAQPYDPQSRGGERLRSAVAIVAVIGWRLSLGCTATGPKSTPVDKFFAALQHQDYETAYGIYSMTPPGASISRKFSVHICGLLSRLGPGGEWGLVKSHRIYGSANTKGFAAEAWWSKSFQRAHRARPHVRAEVG